MKQSPQDEPDVRRELARKRSCSGDGGARLSRGQWDQSTERLRRLRVKGGCRRQADGTAGLPSAPEMPCAPGSYVWCHKEKCVASVNDTTSSEYLAELSVPRRRCEF